MSALDFDSSQNSDQDISSQASNYPEPESQEFFVIEKILNHRDKRPIYDKQLKRLITAREYLIKWQGFSDEHNTWEPYANLIQDSPIMIKRYEETIKEDKIRHKQLEFAKLGLDAKFRRNKGNLANQSLLETEINSQNILSDGKTENIQSKISESSTDDSTSSKKPKINLKINLKKYRNSAELVSELPDQEMLNYEIVQIEPPAGENPDQLIYLRRVRENSFSGEFPQ